MNRVTLVAAPAIILIANAFALVHAARNRMGTPEAQVVLTERELRYFNSSADDDSGVTLQLGWTDPTFFPWTTPGENPQTWLDQQKLQRLGFDCSVDPSNPDASPYYQRQRPRRVFVALESEGPAWRAWLDTWERRAAEHFPGPEVHSHLVAVDADLDPRQLRVRYPDRTAVVIVRAVIAVGLQAFHYSATKSDHKDDWHIVGNIRQIPTAIYVPRPFSDEFRRLIQRQGRSSGANQNLHYRVHLTFGASFEPWVTAVDFPDTR